MNVDSSWPVDAGDIAEHVLPWSKYQRWITNHSALEIES